MTPKYIVERHTHGWLICPAPLSPGIPMGALNECQPMFPEKAGVWMGIAHHFRASGKPVTMAIATDADAEKWKAEIGEELKKHAFCPETRWWCGLDVGMSAAAIFAVFCIGDRRAFAKEMSHAATPSDADDFGRCHRLLQLFPAWRSRLGEVAAAYPESKWPGIIARWEELEKAETAEQTRILWEILDGKS